MAEGNGNYVTIAEVDNWPAGIESAEQARRISIAEAKIELATHDYFYAKTLNVYLSGWGLNYLDLGLQPEILTVTQVDLVDADGDEETVLASEYRYTTTALMGYVWPKGYNNVHVQGTYGWINTPDPIKEAALVLVKYKNDPALYDEVRVGTIREGGTSYTRTQRTLTGVLQADELLEGFVRARPTPRVV